MEIIVLRCRQVIMFWTCKGGRASTCTGNRNHSRLCRIRLSASIWKLTRTIGELGQLNRSGLMFPFRMISDTRIECRHADSQWRTSPCAPAGAHGERAEVAAGPLNSLCRPLCERDPRDSPGRHGRGGHRQIPNGICVRLDPGNGFRPAQLRDRFSPYRFCRITDCAAYFGPLASRACYASL